MASTVQALVNLQLPSATAGTLYTSPTGTWTQITKVLLVNVGASAATATLYVVPKSFSTAAARITTDAQALLPLQSWNSPNEYGIVLNPGDFLAGIASAATTINIFVSGALLT